MRNWSTGTAARRLFHDNRNLHRSSVRYLHEGIRNVCVANESHAIHGSAYIDGVGGGGFHSFNPPLGPGDGYGRGIADDLANMVALREAADNAGLDRDLAGQAHIECEMELAGHDLDHFQASGLMNLLGGEVESALARFDPVELDGGIDVGGLQFVDHSLRASQTDLRFGDNFRADLEILGKITNLYRDVNGDFRYGIAGYCEPKANSQGESNQLQAQIVKHGALEEIAHGLAVGSLVDPRISGAGAQGFRFLFAGHTVAYGRGECGWAQVMTQQLTDAVA